MKSLKDRDIFWIFAGGLALFIGTAGYIFNEMIGAFLWSLLIACILQPLMGLLTKRFGLGRGISAMVLVLTFLLALVGLMIAAVPLVGGTILSMAKDFPRYAVQFQNFLQQSIQHLPEPAALIVQEQINNLDGSIGQHISTMASFVLQFLGGFFLKAARVVNLLSLLILSPLLIFYFLRDWPNIIESFEGWIPRRAKPAYKHLRQDMIVTLGNYFKGQLLSCLTLGIYYGATLWAWVSLPYAWTIGIIAGFLAFIPYVGFTISLLTALGVALSVLGGGAELYQGLLHILIIFFAGQFLENFFLVPYLVGDRIRVHPVWIIFALMAAGYLFGFVGIFLAVPIAALLRVLLTHFKNYYRMTV